MAGSILILFGFLVALVSTYEEIEWRSKAIPNYDLDYQLHGDVISRGIGVNPHIVGGEESVRHSRPYQVGLFIPVGGGTSFCGGSIINVLTVLTAAHCVDSTPGNVSVIAGAHVINQDEPTQQIRYSITIILHPQWSRPTLSHDVAIMHVSQPFLINEYVTIIHLPRNPNELYYGNYTLVSGWGRPSDSVNAISPILREVSSPVISNTACRMAYTGIVTPDHICISGSFGRGTCNGDSGGPLTINGVQIGVVSFGSAFGCEVGWPPSFARVTSYLDWIAANSANVPSNMTNLETNDIQGSQNYPNRNPEGPLDPGFNMQPQEILA